MVRTIDLSVAAVLMLAGCASHAEARNPLLGKWKVQANGPTDRSGRDGCADFPEIDFDATSQTVHTAASKFSPPGVMTTRVIYFVRGSNVFASSTPGFAGAPMYTMLSTNEMKSNDALGCHYTRR